MMGVILAVLFSGGKKWIQYFQISWIFGMITSKNTILLRGL